MEKLATDIYTKETTMKRMIAFDLDGSLETPYFKEADAEKVKDWMAAHPAGNEVRL